jgi:hypothetical protein
VRYGTNSLYQDRNGNSLDVTLTGGEITVAAECRLPADWHWRRLERPAFLQTGADGGRDREAGRTRSPSIAKAAGAQPFRV